MRVLIVDDDKFVRTSIERLCKLDGWEVTAVETVAAAKPIIEAKAIDVVLTDFDIGLNSGLEVIAFAKTAGLPVVLMSGRKRTVDVPFFLKGDNPATLRALLRQLGGRS